MSLAKCRIFRINHILNSPTISIRADTQKLSPICYIMDISLKGRLEIFHFLLRLSVGMLEQKRNRCEVGFACRFKDKNIVETISTWCVIRQLGSFHSDQLPWNRRLIMKICRMGILYLNVAYDTCTMRCFPFIPSDLRDAAQCTYIVVYTGLTNEPH